MGKKVIIITAIAVPIIIIIIAIPIFLYSASNLQQINQEKEDAKQVWIPHFQNVIQTCMNTTGITLDNCKQSIKLEMQSCDIYDNPPVCNDPRINQIMASTTQTIIVPPSTNFITYTNSQFGFSIDYPSNFVIDNNLPDGNIGLKDKMDAPNFLVEIKTIQNTGTSFDQLVSSYVSQAGIAGHPVMVQSQDKIPLGNKEAYRISYTEPIGSTTCNNEDYVINDGQVIPIISFDNCDENSYASFLPTFDKMVSTFR